MTQQQQRQGPPPKPLPVPANKDRTAPFWEGAKRNELVIPHCITCDNFFWHPQELCPNCLSDRLEWATVSGRGRIYGYTTVYQPAHPAFAEEAPYVYAVIQLDEGARMIGRIVDVDPQDWHTPEKVNTPVVAVYEEASPDWTVVKWRPA